MMHYLLKLKEMSTGTLNLMVDYKSQCVSLKHLIETQGAQSNAKVQPSNELMESAYKSKFLALEICIYCLRPHSTTGHQRVSIFCLTGIIFQK